VGLFSTLVNDYNVAHPGEGFFMLAQDCIDTLAGGSHEGVAVDPAVAGQIGTIAMLMELNRTLIQLTEAVKELYVPIDERDD
jgi:hypothetical protein